MDYLTHQDNLNNPTGGPAAADYDNHFDSSSSSGDGSSTSGDHSSPGAFSASSHQDWAIDLGLAMPWSPSAGGGLDAGLVGAGAVKVAPSSRATSREPAPGKGEGGEGFAFTEDFWSASPGPSEATTGTGGRRSMEEEEREGGYFSSSRAGNGVKKQGEDEDATPMDFEDMVHEGVCGPASATTTTLPPTASSSSSAAPADMAFPSILIPSSANGLPAYLHQSPPHPHSTAPPPHPHPPQQSPSTVLHPLPPLALAGIAPSLMNGGLTSPPIPLPAEQGGQGAAGGGPPFGMNGHGVSAASMSMSTSLSGGAAQGGGEDENMDDGAATAAGVASRPLLPSRSSSRTRIPSSRSRDASLTRRSASNTTANASLSRSAGGIVLPPLPALPAAAASTPSSSATSASGALPPTSAAAAPVGTGVGAGMNLVAREAVQAADLIPSLSTLPAATLLASTSPPHAPGVPPFQLLVMGVPTVGAKSRVETQIKISLSLVRGRPNPLQASSSPSSSSATVASPPLTTQQAESYLTPDGGLSPSAAHELERLGSWTHLRLPRFLALKAKGSGARNGSVAGVSSAVVPPASTTAGGGANGAVVPAVKKGSKPEPPPSSVLTVSVAVISATDPTLEVFICPNCQQRELKRSLRKKDPKGKTFTAPIPPPDPNAPPRNEEEELRKVVVFNAPEFVEFSSGECIVPTRITCYCRHHKEKKGFRVAYTLHDHVGNLVATGQTPPIMITDDHKTSTSAKAVAQQAPNGSSQSANGSASGAAAAAAGTKRKAAASSSASKRGSKAASPAASATSATSATHSASGRPRRSTAGRSRRGQSASDEEMEASSKKSRPGAPYETNGGGGGGGAVLGRKRTPVSGSGGGAPPTSHRSPTFAMTPLVATPTSTKPPSPAGSMINLVQQHQQHQQEVVSPASTYASALGLGGLNGDAVMANGEDGLMSGMVTPSSTFLPLTRAGSMDPTGQAPFDFDFNSHRGSISTPPLSPGSTAPSVADTFHSLFSGFPSPNPSVLDLAPPPPPASAPAQTPTPQIPLQPQQSSHPGSFASFTIPSTEPLPTSLRPDWSLLPQQLQRAEPPAPLPKITRIIPGEGPVHGGIEVTVLGENFNSELTCVFGDSPAFPTHFWSTTTLVCVLPPSANPGPVVVGIKGVPLTVEQGTGLQLFTYKDDSDRSLLELALQVVGLKMTGKLENASAIAMRIVGNSPGAGGGGGGGAGGMPLAGGSGGAGGATDTASLAATLNAAASSVYATPAASRASSRRSSLTGTGTESPTPSVSLLPAVQETRNFQDIVIKFLSLLDLDPSLIPGAAPSLPSSLPPISQPNAQSHTLLHLATVLGFHRLVAFLLARGIALDAPDRNGYTALHFAALHGRVAIARLLLDAGARVGVRNLAGKTALEIAQERDDVDVEELLLARGAANVTPTASGVGRRQLVAFSPPHRRRASLVDLSDEEEEEEGEWSGSEREWPSDWTVSGSDDDDASPSEWDDEDEEERDWASSGEEADESGAEESPFPMPASRPRSRQQMLSRNASTVSLHYLLEAEEEAKGEKLPTPRPSPRSRKIPLPVDDASSASAPTAATPLNHLASASSAWFQQKLKPTVQPSLNKLQPFAGGVADAWGKAKANGFNLPPMHIPEITAFHAMPAALTRRMSRTSRRAARLAEQEATETDGAGEEDAGSVSEHSTASAFTRDWRFAASHWWQSKAPSSPPPQYTPTDALVSRPAEKEQAISTSPPSSPSPSSSSRASPSHVVTRSRLRRRTSATSYTSEDTDSEAFQGEGKLIGIAGDRMLLLFWLPVLLFMLAFAYRNWSQYAQPVIDTLADTILPRSIARLLT